MRVSCFSVSTYLALLSALSASAAAETHQFRAFDEIALHESSFFEQFNYETLDNSNWKVSHAHKDDEFTYRGKWDIEPAFKYPGYADDKGLVMKTPAAHHAISYKFDQAFNNTGEDLVVQYEIKLQDGLTCGGTYLKLLNDGFDKADFNGDTPYQIMFGPDVCGSNDRVQFIINRPNPITGGFEEKHLRTAPMSRSDQLSNLYTLILRKNQDFEIRINGEVAKAGNLVKNPALLTPHLNPPEEIEDPFDSKPLSWDDRAYIDDPAYPSKPDDYDEVYGHAYIPDPDASKPDDWDESEPLMILDPDAHKPQDWNDEEDGEWIAPDIPNPVCEVRGCGPWNPPMIPNSNYKGIWQQPSIPNPNYKGEWEPRKILNPDYYEDTHPSNIGLVGGIGFELWTMNAHILFDNIYVGHSVEEAEIIGNHTFEPKNKLELHNYELNKPRAPNQPKKPPVTFDELLLDEDESQWTQFVEFVRLLALRQVLDIKDFYYEFSTNPLDVIVREPLKFVVYCCAFLTFFTFGFAILNVIVFLLTGQGQVDAAPQQQPQQPQQQPKIEEIKDDDVATGVSSGAQTSSTTAVKR